MDGKKPSHKHSKPRGNRARAEHEPKSEPSFWARHRVWFATVWTGVFITVIGTVVAALIISNAGRVIRAHRAPSSSTPRASSKTPAPGHSSGGVQNRKAKHLGPALAVSETPIDPGGNMVWMFPEKLILSPAQLTQADALLQAGDFGALYDFFFKLGGYIMSADTYFIVRNDRRHAIWIENIQIGDKSCQAPLTGTLVSASDKASDEPRIQMGVDLDSLDMSVMQAIGFDTRRWVPEYFSHPIRIMPGATYQFDIRAEASDVACSFKYQAVILDNGRTIIQNLTSELFRVSAYSQAYIQTTRQHGDRSYPGYEAEYLGGLATSKNGGSLVLKYP